MELGVFAMIPQLNAKFLHGNYQKHQKAKRSSSKVKNEDNACVFYYSKGIIHYEFVPECQTATGNFY